MRSTVIRDLRVIMCAVRLFVLPSRLIIYHDSQVDSYLYPVIDLLTGGTEVLFSLYHQNSQLITL